MPERAMSSSDPEFVLQQFPYSHSNDKARRALDSKGLRHRRGNDLSGPHAGAIGRLSGHRSTPVL